MDDSQDSSEDNIISSGINNDKDIIMNEKQNNINNNNINKKKSKSNYKNNKNKNNKLTHGEFKIKKSTLKHIGGTPSLHNFMSELDNNPKNSINKLMIMVDDNEGSNYNLMIGYVICGYVFYVLYFIYTQYCVEI